MNDHTEIKGKRYRYDPDQDAYYRSYTEEEVKEHTKETLWIVGVTTAVMVMGILYEIFVK
jgi:isochorismate hydrolase